MNTHPTPQSRPTAAQRRQDTPLDGEQDTRTATAILRGLEAEQRRRDEMAARTAAYLGEDTGDLLFA